MLTSLLSAIHKFNTDKCALKQQYRSLFDFVMKVPEPIESILLYGLTDVSAGLDNVDFGLCYIQNKLNKIIKKELKESIDDPERVLSYQLIRKE